MSMVIIWLICNNDPFFFFNDTATTEIYTFPTRRSSDLDKAGITTACLRIKSKWTAGPLFRSEERFSRNAETDLVCRLLLEKKKNTTDGKSIRQFLYK